MLLVAICLAGKPAFADDKPNIIWEIGSNVPNSAYWKKYGPELEKILPFDGVGLRIEYPLTKEGIAPIAPARDLGWKLFQKGRITEQMVAPFVENIKAANLTKLTHNLVSIQSYPKPDVMDWFDDAWWKDICDSIRVMARAAKESGCVGISFDSNQYDARLWNWRSLVSLASQKQSYEVYEAKVRQRGREFGKALSEGFSDCTILFYNGYNTLTDSVKPHVKQGLDNSFRESRIALYGPWLDGMYEGTSHDTVFVDGFGRSQSEGFVEAEEFERGRWEAFYESMTVTKVPDHFRRKTRYGFRIWTDSRYFSYRWRPYDPDLNFYSPGRLQRAIYQGLKYSDGYIWLYSELANWYVDGPDGKHHAPAAQRKDSHGMIERYRTAVTQARSWPGVDNIKIPRPAEIVSDKTLGFIDRDKLEKLLSRSKKVMDIPNDGWLFKPDRTNIGALQKWYLPVTATDDWDAFAIGEFWERQLGGKYNGLDGIAWYRREITFKNIPEGKRLYLSFGAVDESLVLWINGKYIGAYDRGAKGWDKPFAIEVTNDLTPGKHTLIMRTHDIMSMGGIWKNVQLIAE